LQKTGKNFVFQQVTANIKISQVPEWGRTVASLKSLASRANRSEAWLIVLASARV